MASTSSAKMAPVTGVPNTAPKPAAIPVINKMRTSVGFNFSTLPNNAATLPPICTAVPSRPAEPPNKCVMSVGQQNHGRHPRWYATTRFMNFVHDQVVTCFGILAQFFVEKINSDTCQRKQVQ